MTFSQDEKNKVYLEFYSKVFGSEYPPKDSNIKDYIGSIVCENRTDNDIIEILGFNIPYDDGKSNFSKYTKEEQQKIIYAEDTHQAYIDYQHMETVEYALENYPDSEELLRETLTDSCYETYPDNASYYNFPSSILFIKEVNGEYEYDMQRDDKLNSLIRFNPLAQKILKEIF